MNATTKVKLKDITPNLSCPLCKGYFVDATTIIECLHSFCKSCIVTHLEGSEYCPVCDVQLHSSKPLSSIRSDQMLQEVVYKLVPGLFQNEMERRRKFYKEHPNSIPTTQLDSGQMFNESYITSDDIIYLSLECQTTDAVVMESTKRYIKCPAGVSVGILKSLLQNKYDLSREATIDMMYGERILPDDFLMMDIAYKYSWTPNGKHLPITFRVRGKTSLFKPIDQPTKVKLGEENKPVVEKRKAINANRRKSLANAKQPSELPLSPKALTNGKLNGKPTPNTQIPIRGRRKKKSLDTEKELSRLRASVSITESREKEVQLRISENGVMSARNVASGEEKIIGSKSIVKGLPPESPNGTKSSHLIIPQIVPASAKTPKLSLIPTLAHSPKIKPSTLVPPISSPTVLPSKKSSILGASKTPRVPRKAPKPKTPVEKPRAKFNKINKNMNLKAITLKIQEELEATINYFAAEITPINGNPPPKNPQPKEGQKYPAATLQPTDLQIASKHPKPPAFNKRLHQTTIINGDVKFTKNVPTSPAKTVPPAGRESPSQPSLIASPTGSPQKTPKFFKSRHVETLGPQTPEQLPRLSVTTSTSNVSTMVTSFSSSTMSGSSSTNNPNGSFLHDTFQKAPNNNLLKITESENPPKKVKLDQTPGPTLSLVTGTVTVPSLGGSAVSTGQQPSSFRYPVGFANGIPMGLVPFVTNSCYSSSFLSNNPNIKNMPVFTHPYLNFTAASQVQSFPPNMTTNSFTHAQGFNSTTLILPGPSNSTPNKSQVSPKQSTPKYDPSPKKSPEFSKVLSKPQSESDKSLTEAKVNEKPGYEESLSKAQTLLAKIQNLAVNINGNGKNPRKSMSPAKISRVPFPSNNNNNIHSSNINNNTPVTTSESPAVPDVNSGPQATSRPDSNSSTSTNGESRTSPNNSRTEIPEEQNQLSDSPKSVEDVKADSNVNNNDQDTNQNLVAKKDSAVVEDVTSGSPATTTTTTTATTTVVQENASSSA